MKSMLQTCKMAQVGAARIPTFRDQTRQEGLMCPLAWFGEVVSEI